MIRIETNESGLQEQSRRLLTDIMENTMPDHDRLCIDDCAPADGPLSFKLHLYDDADESYEGTLKAEVTLGEDGCLKRISYTAEDGTVSTWECTQLNELMVTAMLDSRDNPEPRSPSPWAVRNRLAHDLFDDGIDDDGDSLQLPQLGPEDLTIPPLMAQNEDGGIVELDGVYDLEPSAAFQNLDGFTAVFSQYWYQLQQTVVKYLKDNGIVTSSVFTVPMIERVELINASLYAVTFSSTVHFDDLTIAQQIAITEELLSRY